MASQPARKVRRYVDMWAVPGVHPTNAKFIQQLKMGDTQQFTKNMDVVGTVSDMDMQTGQWQTTHLIGVRTDIWQPDAAVLARSLKSLKGRRRRELRQQIKRSGRLNSKQSHLLGERIEKDQVMQTRATDIQNRRLVLKLFKTTGATIRWCGTIEELTTSEVHNSIGSKRNLLTAVVMLPRTECVTRLQQNHRTFHVPSIFSCCFFDGKRMWYLSLRQRWRLMCARYDIVAGGDPIGRLDGKLLSLGADCYVDLDAHPLADHTQFVDLLTLFTSSLGYHRSMRRHIKRRVQAVQEGASYCHIVDDEELRLRQNGRAAA